MKGLTMAQWINLNWNNRSVLAHRHSVLREETSPIFLLLVGFTATGTHACRQAGRHAQIHVHRDESTQAGMQASTHAGKHARMHTHMQVGRQAGPI